MGLLELNLPPIPLIASTQTHNYSVEKIQFLEKVGFKRVILARELSLVQLREIRKNTTIELECFIPWRALRKLQRPMLSEPSHAGEKCKSWRMRTAMPLAIYIDGCRGTYSGKG